MAEPFITGKPINRAEDPIFVELFRNKFADAVEEMITDPKEKVKFSEYMMAAPEKIRRGEPVARNAFFYRCLDALELSEKLSNEEHRALFNMVFESELSVALPKLEYDHNQSIFSQAKVFDKVLCYVSDSIAHRIETAETVSYQKELSEWSDLYDSVKAGKKMKFRRDMVDMLVALGQNLRLSHDDIDQLRVLIVEEK